MQELLFHIKQNSYRQEHCYIKSKILNINKILYCQDKKRGECLQLACIECVHACACERLRGALTNLRVLCRCGDYRVPASPPGCSGPLRFPSVFERPGRELSRWTCRPRPHTPLCIEVKGHVTHKGQNNKTDLFVCRLRLIYLTGGVFSSTVIGWIWFSDGWAENQTTKRSLKQTCHYYSDNDIENISILDSPIIFL